MDTLNRHLQAKIGQYVLIQDEEKRILLLERARSKNWSLPGGRLDKDDNDPEAALIREVKEETNINLGVVHPFAVRLIEDEWQTKYCVYFTAACDDISALRISDEHSSAKWLKLSDISELHLDEEPRLREVITSFFNNFN